MTIGLMACVSPLEMPYIKEWLDWHYDLGIDTAWLLLDGFDDKQLDEFRRIVEDQKTAICLVKVSLSEHFLQQQACNRVLWELIMPDPRRPSRLFVLDVDEFVKLRPVSQFGSSARKLSDILAERPWDLALNWRLYGSSGLEKPDGSYSVVGRFRRCARSLNQHVKACLDLDQDSWRAFVDPHSLSSPMHDLKGKEIFGPYNKREPGEIDEIEIAHYAVKSKEECRIRRQWKRADTGKPREEDWKEFFDRHDMNDIDEEDLGRSEMEEREDECI